MKLGRFVEIRVFCKEDEDELKITQTLLTLVPINFEDEKIVVHRKVAMGFNERKIIILTIELKKDRHINLFIKKLFSKLTAEQRELIIKQIDSRVDDELNFFLRLDKPALMKNEKFKITDTGNCFHIRINVAAYPSKREVAKKIMQEALLKYKDKN